MFFALHWFAKPAMFTAAQSSLLNWAKAQEVSGFVDSAGQLNQPASYEKHSLSPDEIRQLEVLAECAWIESDYGGYTTTGEIGAITGYCHFELNESRQRAQLLSLLTTEAGSPFASPVLQEALAALFKELRYIEKVYVPYFDFTPEDVAALDKLDLRPDTQPGWWQRFYRVEQDPVSLTTGPLQSVASCLELRVNVRPQSTEFVNRELGRHGYDEHTFVDWSSTNGQVDDLRTVRTYIAIDEKAEPTAEKIRQVLAKLGKYGPTGELEMVSRGPGEWAAIRSKVYPVVHIGQHFVVKPPAQLYVAQPGEIVIDIVPSPRVFGYFYSGFHASTELCLELMEKYIDPTFHRKMLDLGTGTGLQAIAAARLGVSQILALDAYSVSVEAARDNTARNGCSDQIEVEYGSLGVLNNQAVRGLYSFTEDAQQPPPQLEGMKPFDLILANVIARATIGLAKPMYAALRPGGMFLSGGISADREDDVANALKEAGFLLLERQQRSGWVSFACIRR